VILPPFSIPWISTHLHSGRSSLLGSVVSQNGLELGPDAEHGAGKDVVGLLPEADLAAQPEGDVLAVAAPVKAK